MAEEFNIQCVSTEELLKQQLQLQQISTKIERQLSQKFQKDAENALKKLLIDQYEQMQTGMSLDKINEQISRNSLQCSKACLNQMQINVIKTLIDKAQPHVYYRNTNTVKPMNNTIIIVASYQVLKQTNFQGLDQWLSLIVQYFKAVGFQSVNIILLVYASEEDLVEINSSNGSSSTSSMLNVEFQEKYQNVKFNNVFFAKKEHNISDILLPMQHLYDCNTFAIVDVSCFNDQQLKDTIHSLTTYLKDNYILIFFKLFESHVQTKIKNIFYVLHDQIQKQFSPTGNLKDIEKQFIEKREELLKAKQLYPFTQYQYSLPIDLFW